MQVRDVEVLRMAAEERREPERQEELVMIREMVRKVGEDVMDHAFDGPVPSIQPELKS